jgi:hypothetical protein
LHEPPHLFRLYSEEECGPDGYPFAWHRSMPQTAALVGAEHDPAVKDLVRENADNRCIRCGHPYTKGDGQWSPCDSGCLHQGLVRMRELMRPERWAVHDLTVQGMMARDARMDEGPDRLMERWEVEAHWRILTVHHLLVGQEHKRNLKWWNLVSLCQRCHLTIQRKVDLTRPYPWPHSVWFQPYAAGWYAWRYLAEDVSREEAVERLPELLALERRADPLWD